MSKSDKKIDTESLSEDKENLNEQKPEKEKQEAKKEETVEEKLKSIEEKLLRTLAEMENQRRRFEKERQEAFEFGGFNLARESLSLLDNIGFLTGHFIPTVLSLQFNVFSLSLCLYFEHLK